MPVGSLISIFIDIAIGIKTSMFIEKKQILNLIYTIFPNFYYFRYWIFLCASATV